MDTVPLEASLHSLIDEAAAAAPGSELGGEITAFLHESLGDSASLAEWSTRILARLFAHTPLCFFSPSLPEARAAAVPIIEEAIAAPLLTTRIVNETGARLGALGYNAQVVKGENECAFFFYEAGRRRKVIFENQRFHLPETGSTFDRDELLACLKQAPDRFSPNVALRCIVQQHLLPVAAYVAGPGEMAYWAQLKPLFAHFNLPMPIVYPRNRCVLTSLKLNKILAKLGLSVADLTAPQPELLARALDAAVRSKGRVLLDQHVPIVEDAARELTAALRALKGLQDVADGFATRCDGTLNWLRDAVLHADAGEVETIGRQLDRVCTALAPGRLPQERVYTICTFLFEHGWGLTDRMLQDLEVTDFGVQEIEL
jgi:bacillithiol biosynthesis cysteine-adding enzyme BshC